MKNVLASSLVGILVAACGGSEGAAPEPAPSEADGGGPAAVVVPPDAPPIAGGCDVGKLPSEDACVLHESVGVFVSQTRGADANDGSRLRPFGTIAKGIEAAKATQRRVYVCAESYAEPALTFANGVSVFGDLACTGTNWTVTDLHAVLNAATTPAARATDIVSATRIEGLDLNAPNGVAAGESSIGLVAVNSNGLSFVRSRIVAQNGADGADGAAGPQLAQDAAFQGGAPHPKGACTRSVNGLGQYIYSCPTAVRAPGGLGICRAGGLEVATGSGGEGGRSTVHHLVESPVSVYVREKIRCLTLPGSGTTCSYYESERGFPAEATELTNTGAHVAYDANSSSVVGHDFAPGLEGGAGGAGTNGANAAESVVVTELGFEAQDGRVGSDGHAGQGGGGGYAMAATIFSPFDPMYAAGEGGPGGGAGGCPGLAGTAGKGGGASIGVLLVRSAIAFDATEIVSASAGVGGKGNFGSAPTAGGAPGVSDLRGAKAGGAGGVAGWSGHGASGPSLGIAWTGSLPILSVDSVVREGAPRAGQEAMTFEGRTIPAAVPGLAEKVHAF